MLPFHESNHVSVPTVAPDNRADSSVGHMMLNASPALSSMMSLPVQTDFDETAVDMEGIPSHDRQRTSVAWPESSFSEQRQPKASIALEDTPTYTNTETIKGFEGTRLTSYSGFGTTDPIFTGESSDDTPAAPPLFKRGPSLRLKDPVPQASSSEATFQFDVSRSGKVIIDRPQEEYMDIDDAQDPVFDMPPVEPEPIVEPVVVIPDTIVEEEDAPPPLPTKVADEITPEVVADYSLGQSIAIPFNDASGAIKPPDRWSSIECIMWLKGLKFKDFVDIFYNNGFEGAQLVLLSVDSFKSLRNITPARCQELIDAIDAMRDAGGWHPPEITPEYFPVKPLPPALRAGSMLLSLAMPAAAKQNTNLPCDVCRKNKAILVCLQGCDSRPFCRGCFSFIHMSLDPAQRSYHVVQPFDDGLTAACNSRLPC